ncbi:hypothetical protein [Actinotalea sp. C106]|uniref:hypothetical protein n=1 Tax=Actinotalea sp. C106 TaxID=2908644 RepID=UPI0020294018|nr:hypothetical protein [Actinotalea sp. C106]
MVHQLLARPTSAPAPPGAPPPVTPSAADKTPTRPVLPTTASASPVRRTLGFAAASVTAASAIAHVAAAATHGSLLVAVVMVAMTAACLPCAWHLVRHPGYRACATSAFLSAAMLAAHTVLMAPTTGGSGHEHSVAVGAMAAHAAPTGLTTALLVLPAVGLALGIAGLALSTDRPGRITPT